MPSYISHQIFAEQVFLECFEDFELTKSQRSAYFYGAQGPDVFFHSFKLGKFGSVLHKENCFDVICSMADIVKSNEYETEILKWYLYGYICHYCLDSVMHPYVYYLENKIKKSDREAFEAHMKIETNIDTYFINCYKGFLPQSVYSSMFFKRDKAAQTQISKIFKKISKDVFSNNFSEKSFYRAFFNFRFDIANLSRPNVFVRLFLNSSKNLKQFNEIRLKFEMETDFDYPNENKAVWQSPFSNESFDYSVQELFELALNKAKEFFSADFDKNKIKELVKSNFSGRSI